jgi:hypothetical protein
VPAEYIDQVLSSNIGVIDGVGIWGGALLVLRRRMMRQKNRFSKDFIGGGGLLVLKRRRMVRQKSRLSNHFKGIANI